MREDGRCFRCVTARHEPREQRHGLVVTTCASPHVSCAPHLDRELPRFELSDDERSRRRARLALERLTSDTHDRASLASSAGERLLPRPRLRVEVVGLRTPHASPPGHRSCHALRRRAGLKFSQRAPRARPAAPSLSLSFFQQFLSDTNEFRPLRTLEGVGFDAFEACGSGGMAIQGIFFSGCGPRPLRAP